MFVAGSGLLNEENLTLLETAGYQFIVGARLRNLSQSLQRQVTDPRCYQVLSDDIKTQEINLGERRLIISHSARRAYKDQEDRQKAIEKLRKKLSKSKNPTSLISKTTKEHATKIYHVMGLRLSTQTFAI